MTRILLAGTAAFLLLSACAHAPSGEPSAHSSGHADGMMADCPMKVPGTKVSAADSVNGETVTFTTPDQVAELRRRVHAMASMHNEKHSDGATHEGMKSGGMMMGGGMMGNEMPMEGMKMPPSRATALDVESGASVTLIPNDPADLQKLRSAVRMHVEHMQKSGCAMMGHGHEG